MRIAFERRSRPGLVSAAVASATAALFLASCDGSSQPASCMDGRDAARNVVFRFLDQVQRGDRAAAQELVTPGGITSDKDWEALQAQLQPQDLDKIRLIEESETPSSRGVRVLDGQGKELISFGLTEAGNTGQCFSVNWGDYQTEEDPGSQSASPNT